MASFKTYLTILDWLPGYSRADLRGDVQAGLTVGVMLIPQGMAYALLAGVPPIYGLYASLIPLVVYPIFGTSRHLAVGIMAIDMLIVSAGLAVIAESGTADYIAYALLLALMVGLIQVIMGLARFGFVVTLLSRPVIAGFTAAAALTIGVSQLKYLFRIPLDRTTDIFALMIQAAGNVQDVHLLSLGIGLGGIALLVGMRKWAPSVPGPLVAVVLASVAVIWFGLGEQGVETVGIIPTGLPSPRIPTVSLPLIRDLLPTAITLSLVQFMSVISLGKVFAARHQYTVDANRELLALGVLNVAGSFFRSVPVSGSFSRSAVNEQSGGRTAMSNVVAAALIALTLLYLTPLFRFLPIPIFASIIMVAAFGLIDIKELRFLLRTKRVDGWIAIGTFASTLLIGIQEGVLIGVAMSVVAIMYRITRPHVAELGLLPGTHSYRNLDRHDEADSVPGVYVVRVDASFSFANADFFRDLILDHCSAHPEVRAVVVDATSINDLDTTATAVISHIADVLDGRGITISFGSVKGPVMDVFRESGLYDRLGCERFHLNTHTAVASLRNEANSRPSPDAPAP